MEWQAVVLAMQIMMLAVGWVLFQKARAELAAQAAENPVLSEVRALQRNVKELLAELEETGDVVSSRLEARCLEARELLHALELRMETVRETAPSPKPAKRAARRAAPVAAPPVAVVTAETTPKDTRRKLVYALADAGQSSADIARQNGLSEGEVETLLGLRLQKRG